jgi:hypothetical protein
LTRLALAVQAYQAALRAARARSSPRTWARLLRAAQNLRQAGEEREAARQTQRPRDR